MTQKTQSKKSYEADLVEEVLTIGSILIKFGFDHILEDQNLFIEVLNELGIRNANGRELTRPSLLMIFERTKGIGGLIETFTNEFKSYYIVSELMIRQSTRQEM